MLSRRNLAVLFVAVMLMSALAGCAAGAVEAPEREVELSMDAAMSGQEKAMAGLLTGQVEWTEEEFSSLVTALLQQNAGDVPLDSVTAWFTPDALYLRATLADGTQVDLAGNVMVENNRVAVDLVGASAAGVSIAGPLLGVVEGAINRALDDDSLGVAASVGTGDGVLMVGLQ